jgi:hypothetical protein
MGKLRRLRVSRRQLLVGGGLIGVGAGTLYEACTGSNPVTERWGRPVGLDGKE